MTNESFKLYNRCFPDYQTTEEWFTDVLEPEKAQIFTARDHNSKLLSYSMIHGNSIALLFVDKQSIGGHFVCNGKT